MTDHLKTTPEAEKITAAILAWMEGGPGFTKRWPDGTITFDGHIDPDELARVIAEAMNR